MFGPVPCLRSILSTNDTTPERQFVSRACSTILEATVSLSAVSNHALVSYDKLDFVQKSRHRTYVFNYYHRHVVMNACKNAGNEATFLQSGE